MHVKKHLSFTALRKKLSNRLLEMEDKRDQSKVKHTANLGEFEELGFMG